MHFVFRISFPGDYQASYKPWNSVLITHENITRIPCVSYKRKCLDWKIFSSYRYGQVISTILFTTPITKHNIVMRLIPLEFLGAADCLNRFVCISIYIRRRMGKRGHIYLIYILSYFVLLGCETWSLTLREESRLRVFENRILRRISGPRGMRMGSGEGSTMRNFIVCTVHLI